MEYLRSSYLSLPTQPGVYRFLDGNNDVLYVGKANSLKDRVSSYFTPSAFLGEKTRVLVSQVKKIHITIVQSELESLLLESYYIKKYQPKYNIRLTDGKSYPLIRITNKQTFPSVLFARRADDKNSVYFGPYPSSTSVKLVLKTIRRAFPFQSTPNHPKRLCLYNHLGLCPCLPFQDTPEKRKEYKNSIRNIIRILEGKSREIIKELEKERETASKAEDFEKAAILQKKINALLYITQPFHQPFEYHVNPNLRSDIRQTELDELKQTLNQAGYTIQKLNKIECYDISNFQGKQQVASMVVSVGGEKASNLYRKFKMKREETPNDFESMKEVLKRRLKHTEWEYPDLFIVDGGKGQVSSALEVFQEQGITIPLIGLAKREETIVIPEEYTIGNWKFHPASGVSREIGNLKFKEISLPKSSPALHLIQRIRDEAHRFAITYHKKLRDKHTFE